MSYDHEAQCGDHGDRGCEQCAEEVCGLRELRAKVSTHSVVLIDDMSIQQLQGRDAPNGHGAAVAIAVLSAGR